VGLAKRSFFGFSKQQLHYYPSQVDKKNTFPYPPAITTACAECLSISPVTKSRAIIPLYQSTTTNLAFRDGCTI
jgi:hypothetical protein